MIRYASVRSPCFVSFRVMPYPDCRLPAKGIQSVPEGCVFVKHYSRCVQAACSGRCRFNVLREDGSLKASGRLFARAIWTNTRRLRNRRSWRMSLQSSREC